GASAARHRAECDDVSWRRVMSACPSAVSRGELNLLVRSCPRVNILWSFRRAERRTQDCFAMRAALALLCFVTVAVGEASAQTFVAPPRTIADITAILDQEKPDPVRMAKLRADAEILPPADADNRALTQFYFKRAETRAGLARYRDAIADAER